MGSIDKACISGFLCRLCSEMHRTVIHIYGDQGQKHGLLEKINGYLPITISPTDPLPKTICETCLRRVEQHYELLLKLAHYRENRLIGKKELRPRLQRMRTSNRIEQNAPIQVPPIASSSHTSSSSTSSSSSNSITMSTSVADYNTTITRNRPTTRNGARASPVVFVTSTSTAIPPPPPALSSIASTSRLHMLDNTGQESQSSSNESTNSNRHPKRVTRRTHSNYTPYTITRMSTGGKPRH